MTTSILSRPELLWFLIGLLLFLLELVVPGFIIFFFGFGAWVTALLCLIAHPGTNLQIIIFAVTSVLSLIALRRMLQKKFFYGRNDNNSSVEDEFTGKEGTALSDFGPKRKGKVEFKGTTWNAESNSEIKEGESVTIIEKNSFNLFVEPKK
ncbi:MAG: NfeD family protein [Bacteroidales bacterium]|jgi:membrane protein implicated in regulation of membrane protease activity